MIKTLFHQIGAYKKDSILTPIYAAAEVIMEILIPFVTAAIIDEGIQAGNMQKVLQYGVIMIVLALLSLFFGIQAGRKAASASTGFACNLRESMYRNIQTFSFSNIDKFSTAGLVTRMTTDVTNMQNAYQMILRIAVRAPMTLICSMVMCFIINVKLSLIFLVALCVLAAALIYIMMHAMPVFQEVFSKYDDLNASVQENVTAIRVVKAFVREDFENQKFGKAAEVLCKLFVKAESIMDTMGAGDSYFATFLTYILRHKEPEFFKEESKDDGNVKELLKKAMQAGAEFASKICGVEGAFGYGTPIAGRIIDNRNN